MATIEPFLRPRVAITAWRRMLPTPLGDRTDLYTLDPAYADRVLEAGGLPVVVPRGVSPAAALEEAEALLLSGGGDVVPETYGHERDPSTEDDDAETDGWELALLAEARRRRLPTFGICRGMQLLAVDAGGTLTAAIDAGLHPAMGALPPEETLARRHEVALDTASVVGRALGAAVHVNTIHHYAVDAPGRLRAVGWAPDGVIEAVEADDWPAFGVQWHPEKMTEPEQRRLFDALVQLTEARSST
jgi:putative glutamine amidotransferase